jgi:two-component system chemotaxis sensor kinase CheA
MGTEDTTQYEALLEFVYLSPFPLVRFDETGAIDMMNATGANVLMECAPTPELTNLFDVLRGVDPGVGALVADFAEERGPVCEGRRVEIPGFGGMPPVILALTMIKLGPGRLMAAFSDISRLEAATQAQRFLLDNVSDGLATVDANGAMSGQCSATLVRWLGRPDEGDLLWDFVGRTNPGFAKNLAFAWESITDDILPLEVVIDQLPRRLDANGIPLGVTYQPLVTQGGKLGNMLVVLRDLTAELERERLDAEQQEFAAAVHRMTQSRDTFRSFLDEGDRLVRQVVAESTSRVYLLRALHTLKGTCALFGLRTMAQAWHAVEDHLAEGGGLTAPEREQLHGQWSALSAKFRGLLGDAQGSITFSRNEYLDMFKVLSGGAPSDVVVQFADAALTPIRGQLESLAEQAVQLAERLGKGTVDARVECMNVRAPRGKMAPFWSAMAHAVRNAVDHGIEEESVRVACGKPAAARITLEARESASELVVEVKDDGRGIDWEKLRAKTRAAGLPGESQDDLVRALFTDGISSRDEATETSGRGVGLGALQTACASLGGKIEIETTPSVGTTMRFVFPRAELRQPSLLPPVISLQPASRSSAASRHPRHGPPHDPRLELHGGARGGRPGARARRRDAA